MQIKTTVRNHLTPVRMAIIKKTRMTSVGEDVEKRKPSCTVGGNVCWCSHCGKEYGDSLEMRTTIRSSNSTLGIYLKERKTPIQKYVCSFVLLQHYSQQSNYENKYPAMDGQTKKQHCIYTKWIVCYSAIKKNGIWSFVSTWLDFEGITLSKISQTERQIYDLAYMWDLL